MKLTGANSLMDLPEGRYDGHCHVFRADLPKARERRYTPDYDATPEELCALLDGFRLDGALLVQPSFLGARNDYLLDVLDAYAGDDKVAFRGVAVLDPSCPADAGQLREFDRRGIIGVRLNLLRMEDRFDYTDWSAHLAEVEKLGWHVELHSAANHLPRILPQLTRHHARVVVDHFGLVPNTADPGLQTILAQPAGRLWVKVSGAYRIYPDGARATDPECMSPLRRIYADHLGNDRLVWGSDWPFTQFEAQMTYGLAHAMAQ